MPPVPFLPIPTLEPPPLVRNGGNPDVQQNPRFDCPIQQQSRPWSVAGEVTGVGISPKQVDKSLRGLETPGADPAGADYHQRLKSTPAGWPIRSQWCVWVEPLAAGTPAGPFGAHWQRAVEAALAIWQTELPIQAVATPDQAQVRLWRRKPPLESGPDGPMRASHGRALLELRQVQRLGQWQLEPQVDVLISPGQRPEAIQATSLHELGHAFGLWGHSDQSGDVMAVSPTAKPVLSLSPRDRSTLRWLLRQPGLSPVLAPAY